MKLDIFRADLHQPEHAAAMLLLLDAYARDPAGGGDGLSDQAKARLPRALADRPGVHVLLAYVEEQPAGLAICMEGFSTFAAAPLLNLDPAFQALRWVETPAVARSWECLAYSPNG